jgi:hypothetical protein
MPAFGVPDAEFRWCIGEFCRRSRAEAHQDARGRPVRAACPPECPRGASAARQADWARVAAFLAARCIGIIGSTEAISIPFVEHQP